MARTAGILAGPVLHQLYNALWYPALPFALIAAAGYDAGANRERLGGASASANRSWREASTIWVHAASVGEVEAVRPVALALLHELPALEMILTTMTPAARAVAPQRIAGLTACQLAPLDCPALVRRFLGHIRPRLVVIVETELWPNFFTESSRVGAKVAVVNGRISSRAMRRYRVVRPLLRETLGNADVILVQSEADRERYLELGAAAQRVFVTGNTKFDLNETPPPLRRELASFAAGRPILVAGSTAPGEERMVLNAYRNLCERFPQLALVIAPRHLERTGEIEEELREAALPYARARAQPSIDQADAGPRSTSRENVLLLDTMGELRAIYRSAAIAFVGGSMSPGRGGQSLAEPAAASVPVLFGPYYENQRQIGGALIDKGGGRVINDAAQLESACAEWLANETERQVAGQRAHQVVEWLGSGVDATVRHLKNLLGSS